MLTLISSAPFVLVREIIALIPGAYAERVDFGDAPSWADTYISVPRGSDAVALVMALASFRTEGWHPERRAMRADPVFAIANAAIERERNEGGSSAPAFAA